MHHGQYSQERHATSATTLNGIPSRLVTFETWGLRTPNFANNDQIWSH